MKNLWALVVEADPVNLLIISNVLRELGVHYKRNTTGMNVLAQAQAMDPLPDFVLVSTHMPEGKADFILQQIRADARLRSIPVIAITDSDSLPTPATALFTAVVSKALLRKELSAELRCILREDEETRPTRPDKPAYPGNH